MSEYEWMNVFGDNLSDLLKEWGGTQEDLANCIGTTQSAISSYGNKERIPSLKNALNMSYEFGLTLDEFIGFFGEMIDIL